MNLNEIVDFEMCLSIQIYDYVRANPLIMDGIQYRFRVYDEDVYYEICFFSDYANDIWLEPIKCDTIEEFIQLYHLQVNRREDDIQ